MLDKVKTVGVAKDGSYVCELFIQNNDGSYSSIGFASFTVNGEFIKFYSTHEEAMSYVEECDERLEKNAKTAKSSAFRS